MQLTPWNIKKKIAQFNRDNKQALLSDEATLVAFSQDFGKLKKALPEAVYIPENTDSIQKLLQFASQEHLPITIRGNGLSQNGQSLAKNGGVVLSMQKLDNVLEVADDVVWVEANCSWTALLDATLPQQKAPFILPYNCNLSVGGVLSAGGVGASSFKFGAIVAHVNALEVIDAEGNIHQVNSDSPLFQACLGGQGRNGIITKAAIALRKVAKQVKTFCLVYDNSDSWFEDLRKVQEQADYLELFCSPSVQGAKLTENGRKPLVQWLYGMHVTIEFDNDSPTLPAVSPWKVLHTQEESINTFLVRHNARFEAMKQGGLWDLIHPWYECFVPTSVLIEHLDGVLDKLPLPYASLVHIVPIAKKTAGFFQLPDDESVCAFMILNPGIAEPLKTSCLQAMAFLDELFLPLGGKRYLSGYLGEIATDYWQTHFGKQYEAWINLKQHFDPNHIFG